MTPYGIFEAASKAAKEAAEAENARLDPEEKRGLDCGFAWVDIPTPRNATPEVKAFVKWCKANSQGAPRGYGKAAWQFWSPAHANTQSVSVHYAGAAAFALVLRNAGIEGARAAAGQRLDCYQTKDRYCSKFQCVFNREKATLAERTKI